MSLRVALLVTCLADLFRPSVGFAAVRLLEGMGARVTYAPDRRHGNNASRMGIAKGGKVVAIEPYTVFQPLF